MGAGGFCKYKPHGSNESFMQVRFRIIGAAFGVLMELCSYQAEIENISLIIKFNDLYQAENRMITDDKG